MNRRLHLAALIGLTAASFGLSLPAAAQPREINLGFISTESSSNLKTAWQPLIEDLQKSSGLKVNTFFAPDYAGVIEALRFNKIQVAVMGNKSAMEAVDRANSEVFSRVANVDGSQGYHSLMIVHKDSPLKTLDDVIRQRKDLTLGFGDVNSTSGTLVPGFYAFGAHKVDASRDFKRSVRSNHETNILAVASKQIDVATVASDGVDRMKIKMPEKAAELREVWRSPLIASDPIVWRKDLDADTKKRVAEFFRTYGRDAREKEILAKLTLSGFTPSDDSQLVPIRQLSLAAARSKVETDTTLADDERAKKLKDIDVRLADLSKAVAK